MSTMLLTRASIVDLLKHLHPSHFSIRMIYNGYTTCVRKWAMILKAVAKFRHIFLYQEKRKTEFLRNRNFLKPRRSRQRKTIPYQTNLNSISSHTKSKLVSTHWTPSRKVSKQKSLISIRTWTSSESSNQTQILWSWTEETKRNIPSLYIEDQTLRNFWSPICTFSLNILSVSPQWKYR